MIRVFFIAAFLLYSFVSAVIADAGQILQAWTNTETDKFTSHGLAGGDVWTGNTLNLTYVENSQNLPNSRTDDGDGTGTPVLTFPNNVVGIHFEVSGTLPLSRASVFVAGRNFVSGTPGPSIASFASDTITNELRVIPDGQVARVFDLSEWVFVKPPTYPVVPTTTVDRVTSVDFYFSPEIFTFQANQIEFSADGGQPDSSLLGGTTTYANVSWIISDEPTSNPVPEPSSLALLGIGIAGLFGYGWRKRRMAA